MPVGDRRIDQGWENVSRSCSLLQDIASRGYFVITSEDLKTMSGGQEPRLLAKHDTLADRPRLFVENKVNILPLDRRSYVIFKDPQNSCFFRFDSVDLPVRPVSFKSTDLSYLQTLNKAECTTESEAIDLAHASGLLADFFHTSNFVLTKRGRFGTDRFEVVLPAIGKAFTVQGAQIEIDAAFESADVVLLVEAKISTRDSLNIRQLYYPWLWLAQKTSKPVRVVFLAYTNGEYRLSEFDLTPTFGKMRLVREGVFVIDEPVVAQINLDHYLRQSPSPSEPAGIPFIQADSLDKIVDLVFAVHEGVATAEEFVERFQFVLRQYNYYVSAARYLGLVETTRGLPNLTRQGTILISQRGRVDRTHTLVRAMLMSTVLREAILSLRRADYVVERLSAELIVELVRQHRPELSGDTLNRRAQSVIAWMQWLVRNCEFVG